MDTLNIVVAAAVAGTPDQAGSTWAMFQYLLGFKRLGHRVAFIDPIAPSALQPATASLADSINAAMFRRTIAEFAFTEPASLLLTGTRETVGETYKSLRNRLSDADLLINVSGVLRDDDLLAAARRRVYLDIDPGFTQLWQAAQGIDMALDRHTDFVTIGLNIGHPCSPIPTLGLRWIRTLPPIVLELWPVARTIETDALTTVANWRGYGSIEYEGVFYGQKAHALREFMALPTRSNERFALALGIHPGETRDLEALAAHGWELVDPVAACGTPSRYQRFIQGSKAELAIAKSGYVAACCGWFSDRSICYLASGRPVVAHDTGFGTVLPAGGGLLPFRTIDDLLAGIASIRQNYDDHARAARALAEEYFDSDRVLGTLLRQLGA